MAEEIQAQNIFEYKRAVNLAKAIYCEDIGGYDFKPEQIIQWCTELIEIIHTIRNLKPIPYIDRMIIEMAANGIGKINCMKESHNLSGESLMEAKARVEALCGEYF